MAIWMTSRDWAAMHGRDETDPSGAVEDTVGFTVLVDRHYGQILRYLTYRLLDQELARDLAQDVFLDAYRNFDRYDGVSPFGAWIHGIAHKRLLMHWRRARLKRFVSLDWLHHSTDACARVGELETHAVDDRDVLQRMLSTLSPPLREALLLHSLEGFTAAEIAVILGISPSAAARRISRAKEQARAQIGQITHDPGSIE